MATAHLPMSDPLVTDVDTVAIRYTNNQYRVTITQAARIAGADDSNGLLFDPNAVDELGLLPALVVPKEDAKHSEMGRNIAKRGAKNSPVFGVALPPACLEALGYDLDAVQAAAGSDQPATITTLAGDGLLAFERPPDASVPSSVVDALKEQAEHGDDEEEEDDD